MWNLANLLLFLKGALRQLGWKLHVQKIFCQPAVRIWIHELASYSFNYLHKGGPLSSL